MIHSRSLFLLTAFLTITACSDTFNTPPLPLNERLVGKSPEDQKEVLRVACLNEAEKITGRTSMWTNTTPSSVPVYDPLVEQMKSICRKMTEAYLLPENEKHTILAQKCEDQILIGAHSNNPTIIKHSKIMQEICEKMTRQKLHIDYFSGDKL